MTDHIRYLRLIKIWRNNPCLKQRGILLATWLAIPEEITKLVFFEGDPVTTRFRPLLPRQQRIADEQAALEAVNTADADMSLRLACDHYINAKALRRGHAGQADRFVSA